MAVPYSMIAKLPQEWGWPGLVPRRCTTITAGGAGIWKGWLGADLVSRFSRGAPMPDGSEPFPSMLGRRGVITVTWEDDPNRAMAWRLGMLGAAEECVWDMTTVNGKRLVLDEAGLNEIRKVASSKEFIKATGGLAMLYVDPLMAHRPRCNMSDNTAVREVIMDPFDEFAAEYDIVFYLTHHTIKDGKTVAGSQALIDVCRSALGVSAVEDDPQWRELWLRKTNIAPQRDHGPRYTLVGEWPHMSVAWDCPAASVNPGAGKGPVLRVVPDSAPAAGPVPAHCVPDVVTMFRNLRAAGS
jgi:hypothetical protein